MASGTDLFISIAQPPPHSPEKGLNEINKIDLVTVSYGEYTPIIIYYFHIVPFCLFDGIGNTIIHSKTNNPMTNNNVKYNLRCGIKPYCDYEYGNKELQSNPTYMKQHYIWVTIEISPKKNIA